MRQRPRQLERDPPPPVGEREGRAVEGGELDQRHEVRRRPQAVHVRLARAGLAMEEDPHGRRLVVDPDLAAPVGGRVAEGVPATIRGDDREAADHDPRRCGQADALGDGR